MRMRAVLVSRRCGVVIRLGEKGTEGLRTVLFFGRITTCEFFFASLPPPLCLHLFYLRGMMYALLTDTVNGDVDGMLDAGFAACIYLALLLLLSRQMAVSRTPAALARISRWSFFAQALADSISFASVSFKFSFLLPSSTSTPTAPEIVLFTDWVAG